jgi:hypothetical protein
MLLQAKRTRVWEYPRIAIADLSGQIELSLQFFTRALADIDKREKIIRERKMRNGPWMDPEGDVILIVRTVVMKPPEETDWWKKH